MTQMKQHNKMKEQNVKHNTNDDNKSRMSMIRFLQLTSSPLRFSATNIVVVIDIKKTYSFNTSLVMADDKKL